MSKIGIYKYTNKINGQIYIGQSSDISSRYEQHIYDAAKRAKTVIDKAIQKYGIENFNFEIIEECSKEELDSREKYWIQYYDSYNNGYNSTIGGKTLREENHPRAFLTNHEVYDIRNKYAQGIPFRTVYSEYSSSGISKRGFKKIWSGETWTSINMDVYTKENKAIQVKNTGHSEDQIGLSSLDRAIKQDEIDNFVKDFNNGMPINQIAKKYHRDNGVIEKYLSRPQEIEKINYKGRTVKNINTGKIFTSISSAAKWSGCGATTLTRHLYSDGKAGKVPGTNEIAEWEEIL